jgi:pyruvate/2-oxoglutarate dehydrogenase complex dihydrolipoamide dehydrogenase (E3) component
MYMVQSRQFRTNHIDAHYASAIFRYEKEFSVRLREHVSFLSMDDKHTLKVGEPGCPVAAVERGKAVLVAIGKKLTVADLDFTRLSITPSDSLAVDVPETIDETFHQGKVFVVFKENAFQPSSPSRHMAQLRRFWFSTLMEGLITG